jgi:glycosyltransferase involved in cell wall biosynthesis
MNPEKTQSRIPIAVFVGTYLPYSETFIYDQLKFQQHFQARVFGYSESEHSQKFPYDDKCLLTPIESAIYQTFGWAPKFTQSLKKLKPRLIHAHFGPNGVLAASFAKKLNIPLVVTFHGHDVPGLMRPNKFTWRYGRYNLFASRMFRYAKLFLPASLELARILEEKLHVPPEKILLHHLGIDTVKLPYHSRPKREVNVLMIGRFVEKKGFEFGIQAFAKVHEKFPGSRMTLVGDGLLKENLQKLIVSLGIQNHVDLKGILPADKVHQEMHAADVFMAPSVVSATGDRESGVIVIKEAAATGLPTLGTYHGGIPEIIEHEKTGFLVAERDVSRLASYLEKLFESYELRQKLGKAAREKMELEYDTRKLNHRLEETFLNLI